MIDNYITKVLRYANNNLGRQYRESNKGVYSPNSQQNEFDIGESNCSNNKNINTSIYGNKNCKINIATQNICGFTDQAKQLQWVHACIEEDLDIIGLTETKLKPQYCKPISNKINAMRINSSNTTYKSWWSSTEQVQGSGVGIMVKTELAKHV